MEIRILNKIFNFNTLLVLVIINLILKLFVFPDDVDFEISFWGLLILYKVDWIHQDIC